MGAMEFEWDENKRLANIRKHGIDFVDVEVAGQTHLNSVIDAQQGFQILLTKLNNG